jgi:hypothetical protein
MAGVSAQYITNRNFKYRTCLRYPTLLCRNFHSRISVSSQSMDSQIPLKLLSPERQLRSVSTFIRYALFLMGYFAHLDGRSKKRDIMGNSHLRAKNVYPRILSLSVFPTSFVDMPSKRPWAHHQYLVYIYPRA